MDTQHTATIIRIRSIQKRNWKSTIYVGNYGIKQTNTHTKKNTSRESCGKKEKKLKSKSRLDIRTHFFKQRAVNHQNKLPREVVDALSLSVFNKHLDNALSNMF